MGISDLHKDSQKDQDKAWYDSVAIRCFLDRMRCFFQIFHSLIHISIYFLYHPVLLWKVSPPFFHTRHGHPFDISSTSVAVAFGLETLGPWKSGGWNESVVIRCGRMWVFLDVLASIWWRETQLIHTFGNLWNMIMNLWSHHSDSDSNESVFQRQKRFFCCCVSCCSS